MTSANHPIAPMLGARPGLSSPALPAAGLLVAASAAHAQETPASRGDAWYGQVLLGSAFARFDPGDFNSNFADAVRRSDRRATVLGGVLGRQLDQNWSVELGLLSLGSFRDHWTAVSGNLVKDIDYAFRYRGRALHAGLRAELWRRSGFNASARLGVGLHQARNDFDIDSSRHIQPPVAACVPGMVCPIGFSSSPVFSAPGRHATTRLSRVVGVAMGYELNARSSLQLRVDSLGRFGDRTSVGRVTVRAASLAIEWRL